MTDRAVTRQHRRRKKGGRPQNPKDCCQIPLETFEIGDEVISLTVVFRMAKDVKYTAIFVADDLIIRVSVILYMDKAG